MHQDIQIQERREDVKDEIKVGEGMERRSVTKTGRAQAREEVYSNRLSRNILED